MINKSTLKTDRIMKTYNRQPVTFEKGLGVWLTDINGKEYLDFGAGVAVNALGHSHPSLVDGLEKQVKNLVHVSNLYWTKEQVNLANKLCDLTNMQSAFFCNSGTESLETALKIARKYGRSINEGKSKIVVMDKAFHGRTTGALSLTWNQQYKAPFGQLIGDIESVGLNNIDQLQAAVDDQVCAIIIEPIQGEGGIYSAHEDYLKKARALANQYNALLIFDEVQCGIGRTGKMFAYEWAGVQPDVVCLAKGLGGGVPIGAVLVDSRADVLEPGDHGSTFGGNPLACQAGNIVLDIICQSEFLDQIVDTATYLKNELLKLNETFNFVKDIRGRGLMLGVETNYKSKDIVGAGLEEGLLLIGAGENTIRIVPPLIIKKNDVDVFIGKMRKILEKI